MTPSFPTVSVVMAVKNGGQIMREAIDSILNQTFTDFEFIIINDGSTDETLDVLSEYTDPRIQVYSQENQGLARTLNRGISLSTGRYIARQDHDDISLPERLQKQVAFMEANPKVGLLGTAAEIWVGNEPSGRYHDHPCLSPILKFELLFNNPFVHTSWMFRSGVINIVGYYTIDPNREPPEDYEFVSRVGRHFELANLPERLVIYREFANSLSSNIRPNSTTLTRPFAAKLALISAENMAFSNDAPFSDAIVNTFGGLTHSYIEQIEKPVSFRSLKKYVQKAAKVEDHSGILITKSMVNHKLNHMAYQYLLSQAIPRHYKISLLITFEQFKKIFLHLTRRIGQRVYERITGPGPRREKIKAFLNRSFRK